MNQEHKISEEIRNICSKYNFSGSILYSIGDDVKFHDSFGKSNYELDVDNRNDTIYRIASLTKQFTSTAIMLLKEQGKLKLDDTLDMYISDYPMGDKITIHHLLTHMSGIFNQTSIEGFMDKVIKQAHSVQDLIDEFRDREPDFLPGESYAYSNSGYILLGYIIEKISGLEYSKFIKTNLFDKYNMDYSYYDDNRKVIHNRASGYTLDEKTGTMSNSVYIDMSIPYAAGGLLSTTSDLFHWNRWLLSGKIVSLSSVDLMKSRFAEVSKDESYGYGLFVKKIKVNDMIIDKIYHGGGIPGFYSSLNYYSELDTRLILLSNVICDGFWKVESELEELILKNTNNTNRICNNTED